MPGKKNQLCRQKAKAQPFINMCVSVSKQQCKTKFGVLCFKGTTFCMQGKYQQNMKEG